MGKRTLPGQRVSNYIGVPSVDEYMEKVKKLGGNIIMPKIAVFGWGILRYVWIPRITHSDCGKKTGM